MELLCFQKKGQLEEKGRQQTEMLVLLGGGNTGGGCLEDNGSVQAQGPEPTTLHLKRGKFIS
ncbi:MAG: hypothetical protein D3914_08585 [Candidatus Electrothrix sp. LOE2]|nr:hypothetical protein [Candidatus Electrothrix sp. LOE2]